MTLLDHGQPADTTQQHHTGLIAVLAVLAVALLAVGGWLIVDRQRQQSSTEQQPLSIEQQRVAIMEAVTAHRDALTAPDDGDQAAILTTLTDDATYVFDDSGVVLQGVGYAGAAAGGELTFTGAPVFSGGLQVAIPIHREPPPGVSVGGAPATPRDGTYVFTLREVDGQLKIATIVFEEP